MASEQIFRKKTTIIEEKGVPVEKDRVEKMTHHFEALAEQVKDSDITGGKDAPLEAGKDISGGGKAIGQVGVGGHGRETHETGTQFAGSQFAPSGAGKEAGTGGGAAIGQTGVGGRGRQTTHETGTHFESLSDKVRDIDISDKDRGGHQMARERGDKGFHTVGKFEFSGEEQGGGRRGTEQQQSMAAIRDAQEQHEKARQQASKIAAEERYAQAHVPETRDRREEHAPEKRSSAGQERRSTETGKTEQHFTASEQKRREEKGTATEKAQQGLGSYGAERIGQVREYAQKEVLPSVTEKARGAKDVAVEKGQQGYAVAKDTLASTARTAADKTGQAAEYAQKEVLPTVKEKAAAAKDVAVDATKSAASYTGEKVVEAKDVTVETGKSDVSGIFFFFFFFILSLLVFKILH